jgi:hypothetical protein
MGSGEYKVNMRVAYEVKGKKIFSPWSEEITLNVKD